MPTPPGRPGAATRWLQARSPLGLVLAVLLLDASLAPSLLARTWVFQGVLSGVGLAVGYAAGALLTSAGTRLLRLVGWDPPRLGPRPRLLLVAALLLVAVVGIARAAGQHRWTWERLGYTPTLTATAYAGALGLALATLLVLLALAGLVRLLQRRVAALGARWLPASVAGVLALVVVVWGLLAASSTWVLDRTLEGMNDTFAAQDLEVRGSTPVPAAGSLRSGAPGSLVDWAEVGHQGRRFLTGGPTVEELAALAPDPAAVREPVRVFVGRSSADDVAGRVRLALAEMDRLDAWDRSAVLVVVPTGTGWVNEQVVSPPEHLLDGDVATVGSYGASEAFADLDDLVARTRASLWIGPPEFVHLRREAERERRPGSTQVRPVVGDGRDLVFANRRSDLEGTRPRAVFLQQADDPIVWWDAPTLWERPDWLAEPLDPAVNPAMTWWPAATFLNLTVDMAVGNDFDEDHGHLYGTQPLDAWVAMLHPAGWDADRVEQLRERLARLSR